MRITVLVEDSFGTPVLGSEHGFSLYMETAEKNILFDMGASGLFMENAVKLNLDIRNIDLAVISHGHYDHGGGLHAFLKKNKKAKVYTHNKAFDSHYSKDAEKITEIGIDKTLMGHDRIVLTGDSFQIDDNLLLFSNVAGCGFSPSGNRSLLAGHPDMPVPDSFEHEQNLIVTENGKTILLTGCAHRGIANIIESFQCIKQEAPDYVIGGFHLSARGKAEDPSVICRIGGTLKDTNSKYYTGHCTGTEAYRHLKTVMGEQIQYLTPGSVIEI